MAVVKGSFDKARRSELASFLRSRRERVRPEDVGLAPGARRRTPGLRREELAQLAGVGVTWYTWLEQGRPINASVQVLDAIARVLGLGAAERWHLYRLADVPGIPKAQCSTGTLPPELPQVLDALDPVPAAVYNGKYDLLACNEPYAAMFSELVSAQGIERNALWQIYARPVEHCPVRSRELLPHMVATVRANYARHVGDPEWTEFVSKLSALSDEFAALWAEHTVAAPMPQVKQFWCDGIGAISTRTTSFEVSGLPECRMVTYLPATAEDARRIGTLRTRLTTAVLRTA